MMRAYQITLVGKTPLLMHPDDIPWSDQMEAWRKDPRNKAASRPGDDRTPPFRWLGSLYHDGTYIAMPSDNVMAALMYGGALIPTGHGQKTFKAQTQSGILAPDLFWTFTNNGQRTETSALCANRDRTFDAYQE